MSQSCQNLRAILQRPVVWDQINLYLRKYCIGKHKTLPKYTAIQNHQVCQPASVNVFASQTVPPCLPDSATEISSQCHQVCPPVSATRLVSQSVPPGLPASQHYHVFQQNSVNVFVSLPVPLGFPASQYHCVCQQDSATMFASQSVPLCLPASAIELTSQCPQYFTAIQSHRV